MKCRHCQNELSHVFCDLQTCPPSNAMLTFKELNSSEKYFPLKVFVCDECWLVQVEEIEKAESIFNEEYTYYSSFSTTWLKHAEDYVEYMIEKYSFDEKSTIVEIASNDGYLLQYFLKKGISVIGVEPTKNTASVAQEKGIDCIVDFFGSRLAKDKLNQKADLILGNNVLAHVPDINDFIKGVKIALKPKGINTFEFPHLLKLVEFKQFDTIYHEHFSYLSLTSVKTIFEKNGLEIFDVQELTTHGGSLRIFAKHIDDDSKLISSSVLKILNDEKEIGINSLQFYQNFQKLVEEIKDNFINFLIEQKRNQKKVIAYGAAAKGNTLLNYCGIKGSSYIKFVVDASPYKQGKFLPGSRITVLDEIEIKKYKPDFIIIFPWNLKNEIIKQLYYTSEWDAKFVIVLPELRIL